jgi:hypothetical protein
VHNQNTTIKPAANSTEAFLNAVGVAIKQISVMPALVTLLILFAMVTIGRAQVGSAAYRVVQQGNAYPGYILIAPTGSDTLGIIDNSGLFVFPVNVGLHTNLSSHNNKDITFFSVSLSAGTFDQRWMVHMNANLELTDSIRPIGPYIPDFHEGYATSDTTFMVLGTYLMPVDLSSFVQGGKPDANVVGTLIQEVTATGRVLFEWKSFDHISYRDATEDIDYTQSVVDVLHANSVIRDTDGNLIVSFRHTDEVIKISYATGSVIWRLGGSKSKNNQFRFLNDTTNNFFGFSHQHCATRTSRGTLLMFDNGNLKPTPRASRVVEYEINEQAKTIRKVFEYIPKKPVYAVSMGSARELPNQNILIGYGSAATITGTTNDIAAEEIDRNGNVVATVYNIPSPKFRPYRIVKSTFGMTGVQRTISTTGRTAFATSDSATCIALNTARATKPTVVTAERHHYEPRNIIDTARGRSFYAPARWTVRTSDSTALAGSTILTLDRRSRIEDPATVSVMFRPSEGDGRFDVVAASYSAADSSWTLPFIKEGEIAVAYATRVSPERISPSNRSTDIRRNAQLRWYRTLYVESYDVQVSPDSTFRTGVISATTKDTSYLLPTLSQNTTFWWRLRTLNTRGKRSVWTDSWRFATQIDVPIVLEPDTTKSVNVVTASTAFRWSHVSGASRYRLTVTDTNNQPLLDTLTVDTLMYPVSALPSNALCRWSVWALIDTVFSPPSTPRTIATTPTKPLLSYPEPNVYITNSPTPVFRWLPSDAREYRVQILRSSDSVVALDTVCNVTILPITALELGASYRWLVYAVGTYGASDPAERMFSVATGASLSRPIIIGGLSRTGVEPVQPSAYSWQIVPDAVEYQVQVAADVVFDSPLIDTVISKTELAAAFPRPSSLYAWRVQARRGFDISPWSDTGYVSTKLDGSTIITPTYPVHGARGVAESDVFRFSTNGEFESYEVQVSRDPRLNDIDFKFYCFTDSTGFSFLSSGTRYFWRVVGTSSKRPRFISDVATMLVGDVVSVSSTHGDEDLIEIVRYESSILLINNADTPIASIKVYDLLGSCLSAHYPGADGNQVMIPTGNTSPLFFVVTFLSGRTYLMRA